MRYHVKIDATTGKLTTEPMTARPSAELQQLADNKPERQERQRPGVRERKTRP